MNEKLQRLLRDQRGGMVEYIIVIGLVALLAIGAFKTFGTSIDKKITAQSKAVDSINDAPAK